MPEEATVGPTWHQGVIIGTAGWIVSVFGLELLPTTLWGIVFFGSWILLPVAIYKDGKELKDEGDWPRWTWVYVVTSVIWIIAILPGLVYLWRRRNRSETAGASSTDEGDTSGDDLPPSVTEITMDVRHDADLGIHRSTVQYGQARYNCELTESSDGRWEAAYGRSSDQDESRLFVLEADAHRFSQDALVAQDAAVANNGVTALIDGLDREELSGKLAVFDEGGEQLLSHLFNSNVGGCAISDDGRYVAVSTLNPDCSTYVFETDSAGIVVEHENLNGNKMGLEFREEGDETVLYLSDTEGSDPVYGLSMVGEVIRQAGTDVEEGPADEEERPADVDEGSSDREEGSVDVEEEPADKVTSPERIERDSSAIDTSEFAELTGFQRDALIAIAGLDGGIGLKIKERLDAYYDEPVNHGRLYPNLDELVEGGYVEKFAIDDRSNGYELTDHGRQHLAERLRWVRDRTPESDDLATESAPPEPGTSAVDESAQTNTEEGTDSEDEGETSDFSGDTMESIESEFSENK